MRNNIWLSIVLFHQCFLYSVQQIVHTSLGSLRGALIQASNRETVEMYKSVPYAAPPLGELRFRSPQSPNKWNGLRDATHYSAACMSNTSITSLPQEDISEDCLYINIFRSPKCTKENSCPVVFYIHGGGLYFDSAVMFPDQHLVDHFASRGVILCIPGYRLGALGLFATPFQDLTPYNIALRDILFALQFVKSEIYNFGGEPSKITVMGHSTAGDVALLLAFSKKAGNNDPNNMMFHQAISMSPRMAPMEIPRLHQISWNFAKKVGCSHGNYSDRASVEESLYCLRQKTASELILAQRALEDEDKIVFSGFTLTAPLADSPLLADLLANPPAVPLLLGATSTEFDETDTDEPGSIVVGDFLQFKHPDRVEEKYFADMYKGTYAPGHTHDTQAVFVSTLNYGSQMSKAIGAPPVYLYLFNMSIAAHSQHASDLYYVMGIHPFEMNNDEKSVLGFYSQLFVNFTINGQPSPVWEPLNAARANYFNICVDFEHGLWPHNADNYQQYIVDYWMKNMTTFDKSLSEMECSPNTDTFNCRELQ